VVVVVWQACAARKARGARAPLSLTLSSVSLVFGLVGPRQSAPPIPRTDGLKTKKKKDGEEKRLEKEKDGEDAPQRLARARAHRAAGRRCAGVITPYF
jgi:hypothetical protein